MGISDKLIEKVFNSSYVKKIPGIDQLEANVQMQFMSLECESEVTGEKISVIIAKADKIKFENFLSKIENKYKADCKK